MKTSARVHYILAHIVLAGVVLQFLLAGLGSFRAASWEPHLRLGEAVIALSLLALIASLVSRRARGLSAALFVALLIQRVLPEIESLPAVAALHVLNAAVILFLAMAVSRGAPPSIRAIEREGGPGRALG